MRQTLGDDLESRLRELFERQVAGIDTSTRVWDDAPIVDTDELAPRRHSRPRSALVAAVAVAAAVLVVIGVVAAAPQRDGVTVGGRPTSVAPVHFATPQVILSADALVIDADGHQFSPVGSTVDVSSDPGTPNKYTTLELGWHERGVEMRLFAYFTSNGHDWWANEVRTYNGHVPGDWIYYRGAFFRAPLGSSFAGDVDLTATQGQGHIHLAGLRLRAFLPPAACRHATSKYALDIAYPRVDMRATEGFGLGTPRLLDTGTCTPVGSPASYALDARVADPSVAGLANYNLSPPIAAYRGLNLGDSIDLEAKTAGTTTLRVTVRRRVGGAVVATIDIPITVGS